ncbi:uncharacterized protein [Oscarella lobularis]|uniref:uncharacterized protein n=1 Tax=Oscarella lobularis TaxID=121494 RepID=UPI0033142803
MSLNGRNLTDLKDIRGNGNAINITKIWTASSGETQEFCCEAINERGQQAKECIRAVVEVPLNISFFGVEEAKHGCLSVDMNAVLLCRAVGTAALSVTILGPQKAVVAKSRPGKQETNYTFTSDFTKKGLYICTASDDGHTAKKMYTVCLTGLQGRTLVEMGAVVVILIIAFLIVYIVKCRKGRRISNIDIEPGERDRLISRETRERKTKPYTDSQITAVAEIIRYDWQDTFRAIEPPIRDGERFLQKVKANERGGDDDGDVRSAVRCLEQWSKENPSEPFLKAVYKAAKDEVAQDLSDRLREEFECLKPREVSSNNELTRSTDFHFSSSGKKLCRTGRGLKMTDRSSLLRLRGDFPKLSFLIISEFQSFLFLESTGIRNSTRLFCLPTATETAQILLT